MRGTNATVANGVGRTLQSGSVGSSAIEGLSSSSSELTSKVAGFRWMTRRRSIALGLAAIALLSFWGFYAITNVVLGGRDLLGKSQDPMTVQPEEERERSRTASPTLYQHGPHVVNPKAPFPTETVSAHCVETAAENNETEFSVTDVVKFA